MKIFPTKNEKLITLVIISFVSGLSLGLLTKLDAQIIFTAVVTLFAAFVGAYSAFLLQNRKQERDIASSRVGAGNKAIFQLIEALNNFLVFRKQFIKPFIKDPIRFISIPPSIGFERKTNIDFDSLTYLFEFESPNILGELSLFQAEVESTMLLISHRAHLHINGVQPAMEKAGFIDGQDVSYEQLQEILGLQLNSMMKQGTDQMIDGVESIISQSKNLIEKLHVIHNNNFKGHKILNMTYNPGTINGS